MLDPDTLILQCTFWLSEIDKDEWALLADTESSFY